MRLISRLFLIFSVIALSACSLDASIFNSVPSTTAVLQKSSGNEIVPASQQGVVTAGGYRVQSSVSFHSGESKLETAKGYKVHTNIQSTLFRE